MSTLSPRRRATEPRKRAAMSAHALWTELMTSPASSGSGAAGAPNPDLARQDVQLATLSQAGAAARLHRLRFARRWCRRIGVLHACRKFVTRTGYGEDEARGFDIGLNLAPQPCNEHVYAAVVGLMITARDPIAQLIAREDPPASPRNHC